MSEKMLVKGAYYAKQLPYSVVLVMPDDTVWSANDAPFRVLKKEELRRLPAYENAAHRRNLMTDDNEIFEFAYVQYGLEKMK